MAKAKLVNVEWILDALAEHRLGICQLDYEWHDAIPYSAIDVKGGLAKQIREHNRLIEELVLDYAVRMEAGRPFKGVVLHLQNDGIFKYGVVHGNHRLGAYSFANGDDIGALRNKRATVGAYVIQSEWSDDVEEFARFANNDDTSQPPGRGFKMANAVWAVKHRGRKLKEVEAQTGFKASAISARIRAEDTRAEIETMGVDTTALSAGHMTRIASLKHDKHKKHVAQIASELHLASDDVSKLVADLNKTRTEAKGNKIIQDELNRRKREAVGPRSGEDPPEIRRRKAFLKGVRQFEDLWLKGNDGRPITGLSDVGYAPQDRLARQEVAVRLGDLIKLMQRAARLKGGKK